MVSLPGSSTSHAASAIDDEEQRGVHHHQNDARQSITRRSALRGGAACALALAIPRSLLGAALSPSDIAENPDGSDQLELPELYAFKGATHGSTVIAATWRSASTRPYHLTSPAKARIHAGSESWEFEVFGQALGQLQRSDDLSMFTGEVSSFSFGANTSDSSHTGTSKPCGTPAPRQPATRGNALLIRPRREG
jgi:hypothetical protein